MARIASERDFAFVKRAWRVCFDDPPNFVDWNFRCNYDPRNTLIADCGGVPASNMQLMPYTISLSGIPTPISYISGVATLPEFRRRGLVRELFELGFDLLRERGIAVSLLVPFNYEFYEKFGYKQCYDKPEYSCAALPGTETLDLSDLSRSISALNPVYLREMKRRNGYVLRTERDWSLILDDLRQNSRGRVFLHRSDGVIDGYAVYADSRVHELCGVPPFPCALSGRKPFAMARILDVMETLKPLAAQFSGKLGLRVLDGQIAENSRSFLLNNGAVTETDGWDLELDVLTLAQLVFGYIDDCTGTGLFQKADNYINLLL